jgi:aspartyl-tRNA(Asn)/glutamyl-tRNA(Gln) amidotransferase subunit A
MDLVSLRHLCDLCALELSPEEEDSLLQDLHKISREFDVLCDLPSIKEIESRHRVFFRKDVPLLTPKTASSLENSKDWKDPELNAFISLSEAWGLTSFKEHLNTANPALPLYGVAVAVKDNIAVKDLPLTNGSKIMKDFVSPYDAFVIQKLRNAGAWIMGKTNMDEFAMGSSNEFSAFGPAKNPHHTAYVPGGSSGGSAVAVAAGICPMALGSDTGGSIRQPASFCGVVGIRPSYGLVSRFGLSAFCSSLDQIGPLAKDVDSAFKLLAIISGHDARDNSSFHLEYEQLPEKSEAKAFGIIKELDEIPMNAEVRSAYERLKNELKKSYHMKEFSLAHFKFALPAYHVICDAEASTNLARYGGSPFGEKADCSDYHVMVSHTRSRLLGTEVKRRIILGAFFLATSNENDLYHHAINAQKHIRSEMESIFESVSFLLSPSTPDTAFKFGSKKDPMAMYYSDICTIPSSLAGLPSISIPFGRSKENLPLGMQIIGPKFSEKSLHVIARKIQELGFA